MSFTPGFYLRSSGSHHNINTGELIPELSPDPDPGPGPGGSSQLTYDRSMYPSGWENYPLIYWLPEGSSWTIPNGWPIGTIVRNRRVSLGLTQDARIVAPQMFVDPSSLLEVLGGRNRVVQNVVVKFTQCRMSGNGAPYSVGKDVDTVAEPSGLNLNSFMRVNGNVFGSGGVDGGFFALEDSGVMPADDGQIYCWEGINYERFEDTNDTFVVQNLRIADATMQRGISWVENPNGHYGGDVIQNWRGPSRYYIRGLQAVSSYQGLFMQPYQFGGPFDHQLQNFQNIWIKSDAVDSSGYLFWDTLNQEPGITRNYGTNSFYIQTNKVRNQTIWEADNFTHDDPILFGQPAQEIFPLLAHNPWSYA